MIETHADRSYWLQKMHEIANPVLQALADRQLKEKMPVEGKLSNREEYSYLEAFARLLCGIAPWLECGSEDGEEGQLRKHYIELVKKGLDAATDPNSPDYMNFSKGHQPIVDTAFLAHAILRAPQQLFTSLPQAIQENIVTALKSTRSRKPFFNNWLLFSAMIEVTLYRLGEEWDPMRVDYALKQHEQWYVGDGIYGDGVEFHADYYNSYVIQPMLVDIIDTIGDQAEDWQQLKVKIMNRAKRFASIQERSISPEGTFPVIGRSIAYRFGAFQHLAQMALQQRLPSELSPTQVRCALTSVIRKVMETSGTFDDKGWLRIGLCGHQPELGEGYISTGSLYLCSTVFLPLGLQADDPFWQGEEDWSSKKVWSGGSIAIDRALH
ncbi:hypothetical protein J14TS2_16730 [Bacillus sp. J14TS2]|uniref:DUF2264 domain-containing protein n=1 Tax=Bacillus sp. J14TS2 TaxID=2807188 RepID=UPI001B12B323|nr:DUF2264 domain-containing protein [Bacillus sp. J14TS2]GIN71198.1 hypothetical protein J14TS2_16730 [Bacillus sp. J14TS2]